MPVWAQFILTFCGGTFTREVMRLLRAKQAAEAQIEQKKTEAEVSLLNQCIADLGAMRERITRLEADRDRLTEQVAELRVNGHGWRNLAGHLKFLLLDVMGQLNECLTAAGKPAKYDLATEERRIADAERELVNPPDKEPAGPPPPPGA